jgi:hypothetical protein
MVNYANSKVYCIRINIEEKEHIYVGSTTKPSHVADSKRTNLNSPLYNLINSLPNKWLGIRLEMLEEYPCKTKDQLHAKEAEWIRKIGTLNVVIPGRTDKEYYEEHKAELLEPKKQYFEEHKAEIAQKRKTYYKKNGSELAEYHKKYYQDHKDKKAEYYRNRLTCLHCNKELSRRYINVHIARHEI